MPGATAVLPDNSIAQCQRLPLSHTDEQGNTYRNRMLDDCSVHGVLKSFPSEQQLMGYTEHPGDQPQYLALDHFWLFEYRVQQ